MLKYWPVIEYKENDEIQHLSTSYAYNSADAAVGQVNAWRDQYGFDITEAKVEVYNSREFLRAIPLRVVVDSWGRAKRWQMPKNAVLGVKAG